MDVRLTTLLHVVTQNTRYCKISFFAGILFVVWKKKSCIGYDFVFQQYKKAIYIQNPHIRFSFHDKVL